MMMHYDLDNFIFNKASQIFVYSSERAIWSKFLSYTLVKC